jgi:hypothetical protein
VQTDPTEKSLQERPGYFKVAGAHLYTVLHEVPYPIARVLLVGPFAAERQNAYLPWVRWARYLAARHIEVLRYDYRGVGESTGVFEELGFADWAEDLEQLFHWFKSRSPHVPVILHGLEIGALLAGQAFDKGRGDGLLLWSPAANAHRALRSNLIRWANLEHLSKPAGGPRSAADYVRDFEQSSYIEVEGYKWSKALWQSSLETNLPAPLMDEVSAASTYGRPVRIVKLDRQAAPLIKGGFVGYDEAKDFDWLFAPNCDWLVACVHQTQGIAV